VKIKTSNLLYEAGGLVPKSDFGPPTEVAIDDLWHWTGADWGGLPDKTSIVGTHLLIERAMHEGGQSFAREIVGMIASSWSRLVLMAFAPLVVVIFPIGVALLFMSGKQLVWGIDDVPVVAMLSGLLVGGGIGLPALKFLIRLTKRGELRKAWVITLIAATFDCAAIFLTRHMIDRLEHLKSDRTAQDGNPGGI
jgi:hypothetical protein